MPTAPRLGRGSSLRLVAGMLRAVAASVLTLLAASDVSAQDPAPTLSTAAASHRFFDTPNIVLTGVESAALIADGIYTQRGLNRYPEFFYEADPLARPFVMRGWPGQIAGGILVVSADVGLRSILHRKKKHRLERLVPLILTVYGTVGAIHGARELRRVERER
jgi:hypothetical protein